jgi:hypothetical protein
MAYDAIAVTNETFLRNISYIDLKSKPNCARQIDVGALSAEEVTERMQSVMYGYWTGPIHAETIGLYRARKGDIDPWLDPWLSIKELWYPPAAKIDRRGRFNEIGKSVFYACDSFAGAVNEVRPTPHDIITILVVRARDGRVTLENAHIGLERLKLTPFGKRGSQVLKRQAWFQAILKERGITKKWLLLDNFLSEMATSLFSPESEQDKYKITNAISSSLFNMPNVQGIIYPSISTKSNNINFCLMPHVADQCFVPRQLWMVRIEEKTFRPASGDYEYQARLIRRSESISSEGRISWGGELPYLRPEDSANSTIASPDGRLA